MRFPCGSAAAAAAISFALMCMAGASELRVEPILLELNAPAAAGTLTLRNDEDVKITVQTRVFQWSQSNGRESLDPTTDIVASPPIVSLAPHTDYTVRIVRTSKQPVRGEESYRLFIDQLPAPQRQGQRTVAILVRQSIPVFFRAAQLNKARVMWSLAHERDEVLITASNTGDERLRIADLRLRDAAGTNIGFGNGLVGYVLGRSSMTFIVTRPPRGFGAGGDVVVSAATNDGPIRATVPLQSRR
jgi:fimbrial chaperone protein